MYYRRRRRRKYREHRILMVDKINYIAGCWWMDKQYAKYNGELLYQKYAAGDGLVARHMCGNSFCVNPLHLLRGTTQDNSDDEKVRYELFIKYFHDCVDHDLPIKFSQDQLMRLVIKQTTLKRIQERPLNPSVEKQLMSAMDLIGDFTYDKYITILEGNDGE